MVTYQMLNVCIISLAKSPFAKSLACMHETAYLIQQIHLHKWANGHFKNQASGHGGLSFFSISVRMNGGIITMIEMYIMSTTETDSVNSGITITFEIYITSKTECNNMWTIQQEKLKINTNIPEPGKRTWCSLLIFYYPWDKKTSLILNMA